MVLSQNYKLLIVSSTQLSPGFIFDINAIMLYVFKELYIAFVNLLSLYGQFFPYNCEILNKTLPNIFRLLFINNDSYNF